LRTGLKSAAITASWAVLLVLFARPAADAKNLTVLIWQFKNAGDAGDSWISYGTEEVLSSGFRKLRGINLVAEGEKAHAAVELGGEASVRSIALLTGADWIISGSYSLVKDRLRIESSVRSAQGDTVVASIMTVGSVNELPALLEELFLSLARELARRHGPADLEAAARKAAAGMRRPNEAAFEMYCKGLEMRREHPDEAVKFFSKAAELDPEFLDALMQAGYVSGFTLNRYEEGLGYLDRARNLVRARGDTHPLDESSLYNNIGSVYYVNGEGDIALGFFLKSKFTQEMHGMEKSPYFAALLSNIGTIYAAQKDYARALEFYLRDKAVLEEIGLERSLRYAALLMNIAGVHWKRGDLEKALEFFMRDATMREGFGLDRNANYAALMNNIGTIYYSQGDRQRALEFFLKDKAIGERLGQKQSVGYAVLLSNIGSIYLSQGKTDLALEHFLEAKSIREGLSYREKNTVAYGMLLFTIADIVRRRGDRASAMQDRKSTRLNSSH
jgi:tetratricopeptide (TPR) repeat protein